MIGSRKIEAILVLAAVLATGCSDKKPNVPYEDDASAAGIPKFVRTSYIEFGRIARISRFRSSVGQDYSDDFEHCRSMKHCFQPNAVFDWSTIGIFAPVNGTVTRILEEREGTQVWIKSSEYPDFEFRIFHIKLRDSLKVGQPFKAGQQLGIHVGGQTLSEIAVGVGSNKGWRLVSFFDAMTDSLFQTLQTCGGARAAISSSPRKRVMRIRSPATAIRWREAAVWTTGRISTADTTSMPGGSQSSCA